MIVLLNDCFIIALQIESVGNIDKGADCWVTLSRLQLQTIDVIIPGIEIWLVLKSPKHSQALKYAEHASFVTQEVGILCQMSGGC